jgi:hypothetical protein
MAKNDIVKHQFKKGIVNNPTGRPKGAAKKTKLKNLLEDLIKIRNSTSVTDNLKKVVYNLYEIVLSDIAINEITDSVFHLYFIESEFGIKVGISKDVENRLKQIRAYAPSAKIVKVINYAGNFEKSIHGKFRYLNIRGNNQIGIEWFTKNDDLFSFIEQVNTAKDLAKIFGKFTGHQLSLFEL